MVARAAVFLAGFKCILNQNELKWKKKRERLSSKRFPRTHKPEQINFMLIKGSESFFIPVFNYQKHVPNLFFLF